MPEAGKQMEPEQESVWITDQLIFPASFHG